MLRESPHAGVPQNNDNTYCPANGTSCYFFKSAASSYANAVGYCQDLGGYVVAWNSEPEQLDVERYFISTAGLSQYWTSMFKAGTLYFWADGGYIGSLIPKSAKPYVHVSAPGCTQFLCTQCFCLASTTFPQCR